MRDIMKIPYAEPGTSKKNKTGGAARNPDIDKEVCIGCGQCIDNCPDSCIHFDKNRKAEVDIDYCKGCGICESVCPVKAIVMKERK
jgi:pyruvate ferredoxin oxidoreductase delta subunit